MQYDEHKLVEYFADAPAGVGFSDLDLNNIPHHISCIMDGNGRWATSRGLARTEGHKAGIVSLREIITACVRLGVDVLSAYAFSTENWNRPANEVAALMSLILTSLEEELFMNNNVRLRIIGDLSRVPEVVRESILGLQQRTSVNTGMTMVIALSYSSRWEMTDAVQRIAAEVAEGKLAPADINEQTITDHLSTNFMPDPDLLIRTGGEVRLSNYLLWQCAYTELYFCQTFWPDFHEADLVKAIEWFNHRERRYGKTSEQVTKA